MKEFLTVMIVGMSCAYASSFLFGKLDKRYNIKKWINQKLRINSKSRKTLFFIAANFIFISIAWKLACGANIYFYALWGTFSPLLYD